MFIDFLTIRRQSRYLWVLASLGLLASLCHGDSRERSEHFYDFEEKHAEDKTSLGVKLQPRFDVNLSCHLVQQPIVHWRNTEDESVRKAYSGAMHYIEEHFNENLSRATFQEPQVESLWQGTLILWGYVARAELGMTLYNKNKSLTGYTKIQGDQWTLIAPEDRDVTTVQNSVIVEGDHVAFIGPHYGVFAHFFLDNIGYIAYLRDTLPAETRILLADPPGHPVRNILEELDPEFLKRIDWIPCQSYGPCNASVHVQGGSLSVVTPRSSTRHMELLFRTRRWIFKTHPPKPQNFRKKRTVVYYTRNAKGASHGRAIDSHQESIMIEMVQEYLIKNKRPESLVIFDGTGSLSEQIELFQSAKVVIGPHGGGLANLLFLLPAKKCNARPKVLEFITSSLTPDCHRGDVYKTYYHLYSVAPWVEYHHLLLQPPSNNDVAFIDLEEFEDALKVLLPDSTSKGINL